MKRLVVFGSGSGSNAENIYNYFKGSLEVSVVLICSNKKDAYIVTRAKKLNIPIIFTSKNNLENFDKLYLSLKKHKIDYIILAGFLLKIPFKMIIKFHNKIINIHPSLLPRYGGRGMYGDNIHKAVLKNKEYESGITIHLVNHNYDEGEIILQKKCCISRKESLNSLRRKIKNLEFEYYPKTLKKLILQ